MKCNRLIKLYFVFFIFSTIFLLLWQRPAWAEEIDQKEVLILSSYGNSSTFLSGHESRAWTDDIISSINSQFVESKKNINVEMEYMAFGESAWPQYYELYEHNFKNTEVDEVIALDDGAFNFLLKYGDQLFPSTPVVFSGVNNFDSSMISGHPLFTGILKSPDIKNTIDIALKLHPDTKNIFIIKDSELVKKSIGTDYDGKVSLLFSDDEDINKLKEQINSLPEETIIYFNSLEFNSGGKNILPYEASKILFKDIKIPVYSRCDVKYYNECIGGVVTGGTGLGEEVAQLALRILDGEKPSEILPVEDSAHYYQFNYDKLKQFNINIKNLPEGSEIINEPVKYYNISQRQILYLIFSITMIIIVALVLAGININRRRLAEKLLFDSESMLYAIMKSTPNIIYMRNFDGKFLKANNTVLKLLNISEINFQNSDVLNHLSLYEKYVLARWMSKDEEAWKSGNMYRSEEVIVDTKENITKYYDTLRIPLFNNDGTRRGLVLFGLDITDHKHNEENEKRIKEIMHHDKLKNNFFSNISHELRTPLNLIFSALQIIELKNDPFNEEQENVQKYIGIMRQNCYRLLRIIGNLIDITKIDAGHFFTQKSNKDIVSVVENIVMSVVDYVENKGISITFDTETEEKIMAFDPDAMERIILNLLANSIKFTPCGGSIEVNIYDEADNVIISVKDTGIGIPVEKHSWIFEKFVQMDKSLSRNTEGSGIGLSIVKELVELHNGTIELKSAQGEGSEFRVRLPVELLPEDENNSDPNIYTHESKVERIKIEFSDIYN